MLSPSNLVVDDSILLEQIEYRHAKSIYDLVVDNRLQLSEWLPWVSNMNSVHFIDNFIADAKIRWANGTDYNYVITFNQKIVGRIGIYKIDKQNKIGEIGYWLNHSHQGKGIITKTCNTVINFCFKELGLNRLEIKCGTENYKSQRIPERLHFTKEGILKQAELIRNKFIDLYLYSIVKEEWEVKMEL